MNNDTMPAARRDTLSQQVGEELLVHLSATGQAHCLQPKVAFVFLRCDGMAPRRQVEKELAEYFQLDPTNQEVDELIDILHESGLLEESSTLERREVLLGGAKAVAAGLITTVALSSPAAAQSCSSCDALAGCAIATCPCSAPCNTGTGCNKVCVRCFDVTTDLEFNSTLAFCCSAGVGSVGDCFSAATDASPGGCANAKTLAQTNGKGFYCCCP